MNEAPRIVAFDAETPAAPPASDPRAILNSIGEVVYDWDIVSDRLSFGPNASEVLGLPNLATFATGRDYAEHVATESESSRFETVMNGSGVDTGDGVAYSVIYGLVIGQARTARDAKPTWVEDTGRWFAGADNRPARAHGIIRVITELYELERQLAIRSQSDPLTGALNRSHFIQNVTRILGANEAISYAVLLIAIEDLFSHNETHGYVVGDELIAAVAQRLQAEMRASDIVARYAGNKFALLLAHCDGDQMRVAAQRFLAAIDATPMPTAVGAMPVSIRVGGVVARRHGRTAQTLLHNAEEALESARRPTGERFQAYEASLSRNDSRRRTKQISDEIVSALNEARVVLAFQPVVAAATGGVAFHEALLRFRDKQDGLILPEAILPVAEKVGLIGLLDNRTLDLAVAALTRDPDLRLAINVSGTTIHDGDWLQRLTAYGAAMPTAAARLTIEITETCAIADIDATRDAINLMKRCGVKVAMDDFGAGHTSFRSLRGLEFDLLKIDGAFVQNLARSPDDRFFVRTLIDLARHLEIPVVAEWVEDAETARILADWNVDYLQGHLFGRAEVGDPKSPRASAVA